MIHLAVLTAYPEELGLPDDVVAVTLWRGYSFPTAGEAHDFVAWLVSAGGLVEVIDDEGGLFGFYAETLRAMVVWGRRG